MTGRDWRGREPTPSRSAFIVAVCFTLGALILSLVAAWPELSRWWHGY